MQCIFQLNQNTRFLKTCFILQTTKLTAHYYRFLMDAGPSGIVFPALSSCLFLFSSRFARLRAVFHADTLHKTGVRN